MSKFVLVVDGVVREVFAAKPVLHPSYPVLEVADGVAVAAGDVEKSGGVYGRPDAPPPTWGDRRDAARDALKASDTTIMRCAEAGVPVPQAWRDYRNALRAIVGATSGDPTAPLPSRPTYPAGT